MKKSLLIGSVLVVLGLLIVGFTTPTFAHSPGGSEDTSANEEKWEAMHEACENGGWEAMTEAAKEMHGEDFEGMPCHDETNYDNDSDNYWGDMGDRMGRGMMCW